jgi:YVTN family beta-propeller protein
MSADGKYVVITQYGSNVLTIIDAGKHKIVKELPVGDGKHVGFLTFTKDGKKMFVTNREDDAVYVIDMKKLEVKKKIETAEPGRKFKSQGQVINGYFNVFEVTEKYLD